MSLHMVLVAGDLSRIPTEAILPKAVAHNLSRDAAERLVAQLSNDGVEGRRIGCMPVAAEYTEAHAQTEPDNCMQCKELILEYCKRTLQVLQAKKQASTRKK